MTHDELRKLAEQATPGPWSGCVTSGYVESIADDDDVCEAFTTANVEYIAAASPDVVRGLLDEIKRLTEERDARPEISAGDAAIFLAGPTTESAGDPWFDANDRIRAALRILAQKAVPRG